MASPAIATKLADTRVTYLSQPMPVNMGDWWFEIATMDHFWVQRRFEVTKRLAGPLLRDARRIGEIGCGNGLMQRQLEDAYGVPVTGFELNEIALNKNISRLSPLFCYNIHDRNPQFRGHFDVLIMFDVLEHIADETGFLQSVKYHLAASGRLLVNVPAHQFLYSSYDRAAGHVRRYSMQQLEEVVSQCGFSTRIASYWGLSLLPLLLVRKGVRLRHEDGRAGFDPGSNALNRLLSLLAKCEPIPQAFLGTSVMAVFENHG
ncbi:MAG TPA: class I SAM-dependent methyltransferase [Terriglobales bacterium]|nr:class I SAM-dependent methyltransferase [Terriglobales bacterium]